MSSDINTQYTPKKQRKEAYPGEDPYSRYPQHYGQPVQSPYGSHEPPPQGAGGPHHHGGLIHGLGGPPHSQPPPHYGYPHSHHQHHHHGHPPPPPHYSQPMYAGHRQGLGPGPTGVHHGGPPPQHSYGAPPPSSHHASYYGSTSSGSQTRRGGGLVMGDDSEEPLSSSAIAMKERGMISSNISNHQSMINSDDHNYENEDQMVTLTPNGGGGSRKQRASTSESDDDWHPASMSFGTGSGPGPVPASSGSFGVQPPPNMYCSGGGSPPSWACQSTLPQGSLSGSPTNTRRSNKRKEDPKDKGRGNYRCGRCGAPKKGHVCPYQPKLKRQPGEPLPEMKCASTQVEMDEFLVLRRLNLEIQGFPESYTTEPMGNVGAEVHPVHYLSSLPPSPPPLPPQSSSSSSHPQIVGHSPHHSSDQRREHSQLPPPTFSSGGQLDPSMLSGTSGSMPPPPGGIPSDARLQEIEQSINETISNDLMNASYTSKDSHDLKFNDGGLADEIS